MSNIEITSMVSGPGHKVVIDPYGANPLSEDYRAVNATNYAVSERMAGPPPTLFTNGDLPAFTASGVDPALLLKLPFTARHHAASLPDPAEVYRLIEEENHPDLYLDHPGLRAAIGRMRDWASGRMDVTPEADL